MACPDAAPCGIDSDERVQQETGSGLMAELRELEAVGLSEAERLSGREWAVPEVGLRSEHLDFDAVSGELAQRQHRLERGNPAACDQDAMLGARAGR